MSKVAIYIRVSTNHQIDKDSLPLQRNDLINYCKYVLNTDEYEVFEDAGYSGKNTSRPAFQNMIKRIKLGEFTHLLVWKIDRISRNLIDFCEMYEEIKKYNCTFISKNEQFDTSSAMGEAMLKIILVFAELERKLTGERVTAVMMDRATKGEWNGAPIPLGYTWSVENKFPTVDLDESLTINLIFDTYEKLKSTSLVTRTLKSKGIKTKRNGEWTTKAISDIIRNPFYKGTYRYNYKEGGRGKLKSKDEWIIVENNHPGIVTKEIWDSCNDIMDENAKRSNAQFRGNVHTHVFSNLIKCDECKKSFHGKNDRTNNDGYIPSIYTCSGRYNFFGCNQKTISDKIVGTFVLNFISNLINLKRVNSNIEEQLLKGIKSDDLIGIDTNSINEIMNFEYMSDSMKSKEINNGKSDVEIELIKKEKVKFKRALDRLEDLYLFDDETMSEKDYILKKKKINDKLEELDIEIKNLRLNDNLLDEEFFNVAKNVILKLELKSGNIDYKKLVQKVSKETLKELVNTIIDNIIVRDRHVLSINFKNGLLVNFAYKE
ncbi:MAG: recombinase family protein [Clostridium sp.]